MLNLLPNPAQQTVTDIKVLPAADTGHQVWVIDDFIPGPHQLIDYACTRQQPPRLSPVYPGLRMAVPPGYLKYSLTATTSALHRSGVATTLTAGEAYFAMVTRTAEQLTPEQCIPHFDRPLLNEYAMVHYLCPPSYGGTSFYRYKPTDQVAVTRSSLAGYQQSLSEQLPQQPPAHGYVNGDTPLFERVLQVPCQFNRAVVYPCALLHSGDIAANFTPDLNPYTARFTVTAFLR